MLVCLMKDSKWLTLLFVLIFQASILAKPIHAASTSTNHDLQMWLPLYSNFKIHKKFGGYFEVNPRIGEDMGRMSQLLIRPAGYYKINRMLTVHTGYCYVMNYNPNRFYENRVWQQFMFNNNLFNINIINRTRLEQRWLQYLPGTSNRLRHMVALRFPASQSKWYISAFDELFINLNTIDGGPKQGIDQNRIFLGLGRRLSKNLRMETGYQYQYVEKSEVDDLGNHAIFSAIYADF